jgi:hypothetical protein
MASLSDEQRRALNLLAVDSEGCDEAVLLADGLTVAQLAWLVIEGLATMQPTLPLDIRGESVIRMQITETGRKAIAE